MPNYCSNDLYIIGSPADVDEVLACIANGKPQPAFDFNAVIPYPAKLAEMDDAMRAIDLLADTTERQQKLVEYERTYGTRHDGYNSGGYKWCVENWGSKWNASDVVRRDYGGPCLSFGTAWSPPEPVIVALSKRFARVTFSLEWFERGTAKCGGFTCFSESEAQENAQPKHGPVNRWESEYLGTRGG